MRELAAIAVRTALPIPRQAALDRYLAEAPGQRAAEFGYIDVLAREYSLQLAIRADALRSAKLRRKRLELELARLANEASPEHEVAQRWIRLALQYFHQLPAKGVRAVSAQDATGKEGGWTIKLRDAE